MLVGLIMVLEVIHGEYSYIICTTKTKEKEN